METILLLHGAIGAAPQLKPLEEELKKSLNTYTLNFSGHGGTILSSNPFSIELFANDVLAFLDENKIEQINIFGYSMGGYVGMYLAKYHPRRVKKIITLASKFHWDIPTAEKEVKMINAEKIAEKLPAFATALEKRHLPNDWKEVLAHTRQMLQDLGAKNALNIEDYQTINHEALILIGDRDTMITLEETIAVYKALPYAQMGMLPNTKHPIEQTNLSYLSFIIEQFITL